MACACPCVYDFYEERTFDTTFIHLSLSSTLAHATATVRRGHQPLLWPPASGTWLGRKSQIKGHCAALTNGPGRVIQPPIFTWPAVTNFTALMLNAKRPGIVPILVGQIYIKSWLPPSCKFIITTQPLLECSNHMWQVTNDHLMREMDGMLVNQHIPFSLIFKKRQMTPPFNGRMLKLKRLAYNQPSPWISCSITFLARHRHHRPFATTTISCSFWGAGRVAGYILAQIIK